MEPLPEYPKGIEVWDQWIPHYKKLAIYDRIVRSSKVKLADSMVGKKTWERTYTEDGAKEMDRVHFTSER